MLKNYIKIGWRNIVRHPFYSLVNIAGLFSGIAFSLLIGAYVWGELQVDRNLNHSARQYILKTISKDPNIGYELATFGPLAKRLKEDYPGLIANYYRYDGVTSIVSRGDKHFREGIQIGDSTLLSMYGFGLIYGDQKTALNQPYSVVITKDAAIKYFGMTDVVGKVISIQSFSGSTHDFLVTGVLKEIPENTVTQLSTNYNNDFFIPTVNFSFFGRADFESWSNIFIASYIELKQNTSVKDIEKPIQKLIQQNAGNILAKNLSVQPVLLTSYHLQKENGIIRQMLYTLSFAGLFILLMAVVNFINITISRSSARMKEIGIRKVLGGLKKQLIAQFLTESIILVFIATVLAIAAYPLLSPVFNTMVGKQLVPLSAFPSYFVMIPIAIVLLLGLTAGFYPAFVLSSLKSVDSLKGKLKTVKENIVLRKSLVGFQFCIALIVLIAATIISQQVAHFFSQNLGYNKEYITSSQVPRDWTTAGVQKMQTIRNEFAKMPQISSATLSFEIPDGNNVGQASIYKSGTDSTMAIATQLLITDENYLNTYQIPLKAGAFFDDRRLDSGKVIMNEKAIAALGYANVSEAIGQQVRIPGDATLFTIKGVVKDFHFGSMQQTIPPIMFFNVNVVPTYRFLSFKIKPGNIATTIEAIQKKWAILLPGTSFEYSFMDNTLEKLYATEIQLKKAAYTATVLALVIALLGVLSLVSLSMQKRVKEVGIRKVLGASLQDIVRLFVKEFIVIIIIAAVIACPLALLLMKNWLNNYAYRIKLTVLPFLWAIIGLGLITVLLIGLQTVKAAIANPVKNLRTE